MYSNTVEIIFDIAAEEAASRHFKLIELEHFLIAILRFQAWDSNNLKRYGKSITRKKHQTEAKSIIQTIKERGLDIDLLIKETDKIKGKSRYIGTMHRSSACRLMFNILEKSHDETQSQVSIRNILEYILNNPSPPLTKILNRCSDNEIEQVLNSPVELSQNMKEFYDNLINEIFGQDEAVRVFSEAVNNAQIFAEIDTDRKTPQAILLFAGPPGVGKTFLAETGAKLLGRHFKRFDMSGYAEHHQHESLIGLAKGYKEARSGLLTDEVKRFPDSILLFDEIEKAHINTIHLFLQILDSGRLEDKYTLEEIYFRDTIIIFTTNAGKKLYENSNISELTTLHSKTILNALENETDPETQKPKFPSSICSRLSSGYVVLFNRLNINNLVKIADLELNHFAKGFFEKYKIKVSWSNLVSYLLVLREGAKPDARTILSQAAKFIKTEIFKNLSFINKEEFKLACSDLKSINFVVEEDILRFPGGETPLFSPPDPTILLIADPIIVENYKLNIPDYKWLTGDSKEGWLNFDAGEKIDMILLDPRMKTGNYKSSLTYVGFSNAPHSSKRFDTIRDELSRINKELPDTPVFLLIIQIHDDSIRTTLGEDLVDACLHGGGASGILPSRFTDRNQADWPEKLDEFIKDLEKTWERIYREKMVQKLGKEHKIFNFETAPFRDVTSKTLRIRLRNPKMIRAMEASDIGNVLDEIERPVLTFKDVFGAETAKKELQFFIDYVKNPIKYKAYNLKPPKGILLYGPSGTGKTMLAKAFAGESNLAFLYVSASSLITVWKGSGTQNIRDLFTRARKYAPSVIFIDEIDAIGKSRSGEPSMQSEENTLNTLLVEMDGFISQSAERPVFILAATNFIMDAVSGSSDLSFGSLDPALLRRFSKIIFVDLPDKKTRLEYLKSRLLGRPGSKIRDDLLANIADRSSGMSFADLESIIESAARESALNQSDLDINYLNDALDQRYGDKNPVEKEMLKSIAYHEASHTLIYYLTEKKIPPYVTIVARGKYGGYMATESIENGIAGFTKDQLLGKVRIALAGRAIEEIKHGDEGITTGSAYDLEYASDILRQMICSYGMFEEFGLFTNPELLRRNTIPDSTIYTRMNDLANRVLNEQLALAKSSLEENMEIINVLVKELLEKEKLTGEDLVKLLPQID
jgi:ATP-dependent metalloprotease FtsH